MSLPKKEILKIKNAAEKIALGAGKILAGGFLKNKDIKYKGRIDPVTEFDLKSEKYIIAQICKAFPAHSILSEEGSSIDNNSDFCWVIDPLDGTVNYAHRLPSYAVSIALQYKDRTIVGVVYAPELKEFYSAALGCGAFLNKKKIHVSSEKKLERSLLATGFSYNISALKRNNLGMFSRMMKQAQAVRRFGSAALDICWVADGRFEGFWEYNLAPWDSAAGIIILTEAGGKVTQIKNLEYSIFDDSLLASNGLIHKSMRDVLVRKK